MTSLFMYTILTFWCLLQNDQTIFCYHIKGIMQYASVLKILNKEMWHAYRIELIQKIICLHLLCASNLIIENLSYKYVKHMFQCELIIGSFRFISRPLRKVPWSTRCFSFGELDIYTHQRCNTNGIYYR